MTSRAAIVPETGSRYAQKRATGGFPAMSGKMAVPCQTKENSREDYLWATSAMRERQRLSTIALTSLLLASVSVAAQTPPAQQSGIVRIVVHDPTDLPVQDAEVTLSGADATTFKAVTSERGEARFDGLRPGTYSGEVTSPGFSPYDLGELLIRSGGRVTKQATLQVAGFFEAVDVAPPAEDRQLMEAFTRRLTPEQLAALPEDPEELARVLAILVGSDADIRVNGFRGGRLPLGTEIRDIRIFDDIGAASSGGGPRVEIQTVVGGDRWRNNAGLTLHDEALNARNAFSGLRPTGQTRQYSWSLDGPLIRNQTGLSVSINGAQSMDNRTIRAAVPDGILSRLVEQPSTGIGLSIRLDHEITAAQAIRLELTNSVDEAQNQGVGDFDLPERGFTSKGDSGALRLGHHATFRRGYVNDLRVAVEWATFDAYSLSNAKTTRVLDAFTSGGAQLQGGQRSRSIDLENELEFVARKRHRITAGVSVNGSDYRGDEQNNAAGTYTFSSLAAFEAGQPTTFTQRLGDPNFRYSLYRFGWHVQDDYRVRRNVMVNLGLRHDFQTHMRDWVNLSPRLGVSWTPSSTARTTFRASAGIVHWPLDADVYGELVRVDGVAQRDLVISNPGYPDPFSAGVTEAALPPSIIRAGDDMLMPSGRRYSFGADQPIGKLVRFRSTFVRQTGDNLFRSRDANGPVNGIRPDPLFLSITELETTARSLKESLQTEVMFNYPPRRLSANVNYTFGKTRNETDGAFSLPADSSDSAGEWGPSLSDATHVLSVGLNSDLVGGLRGGANFRTQSGLPYNITTGSDANGDGVFNERPAGVTRNSARTAVTKNLDLTLTWTLGLRQPRTAVTGSSNTAVSAARPENALFRVEMFARATNVLNLVNPMSFSGVVTSPFFGLPTSAGDSRRVAVGTRVWF
jgi:hypothetical protein